MLEHGKRYSFLRVYFNKKNEYPLVWSIDDGNLDNEIKVSMVVCEALGWTIYNGEPANELSPVAWVEFQCSLFHIQDNIAYLS